MTQPITDPTILVLLYFVLPLWLVAGFADWLCHRATSIESTGGAKESLLHLLMLAQVGIPLTAALVLDINALVILLMLVAFVTHEATAMWDVRYATGVREVTPVEQHVHSFLEIIPLASILLVISRHWDQFLALFGAGDAEARFGLAWKYQPLPLWYLASIFGGVLLFAVLPYAEELWRGIRHARAARRNALRSI